MTDNVAQKKTGRRALTGLPPKQGLYDPYYEHDSCGVGFVVNMKGRKSHQIIEQGLRILVNLDHRGACGCEANTGDGAGILLQTPHTFLSEVCREAGFQLPDPGQYGAGLVFLPPEREKRADWKKIFWRIVIVEGQRLIGWHTGPTN